MFRFEQPLLEGTIVKRRNRFVMDVLLDDEIVACHCPVTGRIGDVVFDGVPCLVSRADGTNRTTRFTVEAVSIDDAQWIGIHQGRVNDYVAHLLCESRLPLFPKPTCIEREIARGDSRIDFAVDGILMEVKMPLTELFVTPLPRFARKKAHTPVETKRLARHIETLIQSLEQNGRAILLYVFLYDAPVFTGNPNRRNDDALRRTLRAAIPDGLEVWQLNARLSPEGIDVIRCAETTTYQ